MTQASDIEKAHAHLVEQRRSIIEALAKGYQRGQTETQLDLLQKFQNAIDILDKVGRVTADEAIEQARQKLATAYERHPDDTSDN
jgi:hypothetical protein